MVARPVDPALGEYFVAIAARGEVFPHDGDRPWHAGDRYEWPSFVWPTTPGTPVVAPTFWPESNLRDGAFYDPNRWWTRSDVPPFTAPPAGHPPLRPTPAIRDPLPRGGYYSTGGLHGVLVRPGPVGAHWVDLDGDGDDELVLEPSAGLEAAVRYGHRSNQELIGQTPYSELLLTTVSVNAAARTFTRGAGSWLTEFRAGNAVKFVGFSNAGNNRGFFLEDDPTATVMTVLDPASSLVNESVASGAVQVTRVSSYDYNLQFWNYIVVRATSPLYWCNGLAHYGYGRTVKCETGVVEFVDNRETKVRDFLRTLPSP